MMKWFLICLSFSALACKQGARQDPEVHSINQLKAFDSPIKELGELQGFYDSDLSYDSIKSSIKKIKRTLETGKISTDSLGKIFTQSLVYRIFPFWEDTDWSFEGHSSVPKVGEIACGYFVSTTLQDVGLNLNRYRLAQQNPRNEAKSLALGSEIIEIAEGSKEKNIEKINERLPEGIHFIGLGENHVGFILKKQDQLYFIHSNYMGSRGVELETIEDSQVFNMHQKYYLVELSTNEKLLTKWITGEEIKVLTE